MSEPSVSPSPLGEVLTMISCLKIASYWTSRVSDANWSKEKVAGETWLTEERE